MSPILAEAIAAGTATLTRAVTPPTLEGYGVDLVCITDLTLSMAEVDPNSIDGLRQDAFHRITTRRGSLPEGDDPDYGFDCRTLLHKGTDARTLVMSAGSVKNELLKDDREDDAEVSLVPTPDGSELRIPITLTPVDPALSPFSMMVVVRDGQALLEATT
jgi:hypothetical protein